VRFRHQAFVHDFVRDALREALAISKPISTFPAGATVASEIPTDFPRTASATPRPPDSAPSSAPGDFRLTEPPLPPTAQPLAFYPALGTDNAALGITAADTANAPAPADNSFGAPQSASEAAGELAQLQPLGQIRDSFIVAASPSGLWLIDQHVAHERVLFERFLAKRERGSVETQRLLMPYILHLSPAQRALWDQIAAELVASGFEAEPFGQGTMAVKAIPAGVKSEEIEKLLAEIVESLEKESRAVSPERMREKIAASVACHAAIKINTPLEPRKMEWLLAELAATRLPMSCPHGRPVVLKYGMREILKAFHRI
jgi:DNA mismatch repair protein MutL